MNNHNDEAARYRADFQVKFNILRTTRPDLLLGVNYDVYHDSMEDLKDKYGTIIEQIHLEKAEKERLHRLIKIYIILYALTRDIQYPIQAVYNIQEIVGLTSIQLHMLIESQMLEFISQDNQYIQDIIEQVLYHNRTFTQAIKSHPELDNESDQICQFLSLFEERQAGQCSLL